MNYSSETKKSTSPAFGFARRGESADQPPPPKPPEPKERPDINDLKEALVVDGKPWDNYQWEEFVTNNYHKISRADVEGRHVLDVGGSIGFTALYFLYLGAKSVVTVEANPHNFEVLKRNVAKWPMITPIHAAAADGVARQVRILEGDGKGVSKTVPDDGGGVLAVGLGDLLGMFPPDASDMFMKVDIEGAEYDFLISSKKSELARFKTCVLETHQVPHLDAMPARKRKFLLEYFELMGFEKASECPVCLWYYNPDGTVKECVVLEDQGDAKMVRKA